MKTQQSQESSWWRLDVPRQEELSGIPYQRAMSAEELLQELLCQRLEQDFQLLRPRNMSKLLTLRKEQTYYLSQGSQVQRITFVHDGQLRPAASFAPTSRTARSPPTRGKAVGGVAAFLGGGDGANDARTKAAGGATPRPLVEPSMGFSEILVTRHLVHQQRHHKTQPAPPRPIGYHYFVCAPHGVGYQQAFAQIRSNSPHDFPWNRLDQVVCGWDCDLDLGLKLKCKRFALLDFHEQLEDSMRRLLSAPAGTQRLLSAAMAMTENFKSSSASVGGGNATPSATPERPVTAASSSVASTGPAQWQELSMERERDPSDPALSRDRFERFVAVVRSRLPIGDRVQWIDAPEGAPQQAMPPPQSGSADGVGGGSIPRGAVAEVGTWFGAGVAPRTHRRLLDMTPDDSPSAAVGNKAGIGGGTGEHDPLGARRMFVQLLFDASASSDACWHLEIRWNMCRGDKVEELIKYCARRAKQAGMLLLQVPTGRRPRPFSPPVLVPVPARLQPRALLQLRTRLCFVRESSHAAGDLHAGSACGCRSDRSTGTETTPSRAAHAQGRRNRFACAQGPPPLQANAGCMSWALHSCSATSMAAASSGPSTGFCQARQGAPTRRRCSRASGSCARPSRLRRASTQHP